MAEQSTTTSTGPGSECECESSSPTASDSGPSADVQSFVNRFRRLSELTRKRTIRITNGTRKRKAKPSCCTEPKSVTPMQ